MNYIRKRGRKSIHDTAKILSTYGDGFMFRTDSDNKIEEFSKYLKIPIIKWFKSIISSNTSFIRYFYS